LFGGGKGKAKPGAGDDLPEPEFDAGEPVAEEGFQSELDELRGGR
jgi:hypothetical protein